MPSSSTHPTAPGPGAQQLTQEQLIEAEVQARLAYMQQTGQIQYAQPHYAQPHYAPQTGAQTQYAQSQYAPQAAQPQPQVVQAQPEEPKKHTGWGSYGKNLKEKRGKKKNALLNLGYLGSLAG